MLDSDAAEFDRHLSDVMATYYRGLEGATKRIWFATLKPYELPAVVEALYAHIADADRGRRCPVPADIKARIAHKAARGLPVTGAIKPRSRAASDAGAQHIGKILEMLPRRKP